MKIMRFTILLAAVAFAANERCDDLDGSEGGSTHTDVFVLASCDAGFKLIADQTTACGAANCSSAECCETGVATDNVAVLSGGTCPTGTTFGHDDVCADGADACAVGYTQNAASNTAQCAGLTKTDWLDANSAGHTSAGTLTHGASAVTVTCNVGWAQTGTDATYDVTLGSDGTTLSPATGCAAIDCINAASDTQATAKDCNTGTIGGTGSTCTCDCDAVWFDGDLCADAMDIAGDANSNTASATPVTSTGAVTFTCSGTNLAALTSAANGAGGAATYTVSSDAAGVLTYAPGGAAATSCQAVLADCTVGDSVATTTMVCDATHGTIGGVDGSCTCGCASGWEGADCATETVAACTATVGAADATLSTIVCDATHGVAAGAIAVSAPSTCSCTCTEALLWGGADCSKAACAATVGAAAAASGTVVCDATNGTVGGWDGGASTTDCTCTCASGFGGDDCSKAACTATVGAAAAASGTVVCDATNGAAAGFDGACTCTCANSYTGDDCATAPVAASPASASTSVSADDSGVSSAFIAGTAIAGIALLL